MDIGLFLRLPIRLLVLVSQNSVDAALQKSDKDIRGLLVSIVALFGRESMIAAGVGVIISSMLQKSAYFLMCCLDLSFTD